MKKDIIDMIHNKAIELHKLCEENNASVITVIIPDSNEGIYYMQCTQGEIGRYVGQEIQKILDDVKQRMSKSTGADEIPEEVKNMLKAVIEDIFNKDDKKPH